MGAGAASRVAVAWRALQDAIPRGVALPDEAWRRRHLAVRNLLAIQGVALVVFAVVRGFPVLHSVTESGIVIAAAVGSGWKRLTRKQQAMAATLGLMSTSALLVHFSGGTIEAHFHFFVMIAVISLYQDWSPFLLALGFVIVHHGLMGVIAPDGVYNHPAAWAHPWIWAGIHGFFVLAASAVNVISWRLNEVSRARSDLILNAAGEGIVGLDAAGRVTFMNESAERMLARSKNEALGSNAHVLFHGVAPAAETGCWCCDPETIASSAVDRFTRADGSEFPAEYSRTLVREAGAGAATVVTFRDITERERAGTELNNTLSTLAATLESTADGILVVDATGKITILNQKFAEMWRIPPEILASNDDDRALAFVLDQLADPEGFLRKVRELYAQPEAESFDVLGFKDGRTFERYSKPQWIAGVAVGRVWSFRDITERNRLDEMKNGFLSAVSHELRTPLTAVLGYALTLERMDESLPDADRGILLGRLSASARKLQRLLTDTLDLDRLSRGILEPIRRPIDVGSVVRLLLRETDFAFERSIQVQSDGCVVAVDQAKVERIVENLLINAIRHTDPGTPVWVHVRGQDGGVLITVEDGGAGVPRDHWDSIFESFRQGPTVSAHSPGFGIGLSLVARFASLHGGRAWVTDREGGGASFNVFLPGGETTRVESDETAGALESAGHGEPSTAA